MTSDRPTLDTLPPSSLEHVGRCPACDSPSRRYLFEARDWIHLRPGLFSMVRCRRCRAVYPDPRPTAEALADYYPQGEYYAYGDVTPHRLFDRKGAVARLWYEIVRGILACRHGYRHLGGSPLAAASAGRLPPIHRRATHRLGVLLHPWREDGALLDVGCGSGSYLDLMRALGWSRAVGVDVSSSAIAAARASLDLEVYEGDLQSAGFADDTFDAVTLSHTLEHVARPVELLAEVRRITKPGGRIAIVVPNVSNLTFQVMRQFDLVLETPRHLVNFTPRALRTTIERAGLEIESLATPIEGSYGVALFSRSRALGDPHSVYTDPDYRFGLGRRAEAAALAGAEICACALGLKSGGKICAVARA